MEETEKKKENEKDRDIDLDKNIYTEKEKEKNTKTNIDKDKDIYTEKEKENVSKEYNKKYILKEDSESLKLKKFNSSFNNNINENKNEYQIQNQDQDQDQNLNLNQYNPKSENYDEIKIENPYNDKSKEKEIEVEVESENNNYDKNINHNNHNNHNTNNINNPDKEKENEKNFKETSFSEKIIQISKDDFSRQINFEKILNVNYNCKHQFRICLVGDSNVGKTSLLNRYCDDIFKNTQISTIGVDFKVLLLKFNDLTIKLQIWDTAGQERFRSISVNYFKSAHGFLIVYDITNRNSFNNLNSWIDLVSQHNQNTACNFIVGNKCDLNNQRAIDIEEGKKFAFSKKFNFMETSAKNNINIDIAFQIFTLKLVDYFNIKPEKNKNMDADYLNNDSCDIENVNKGVVLNKNIKIKNKKKCKC
jgi:Ras-related protein Rab-1A